MRLAVALVASALALFLGLDILLVALRSQRHFSALAWIIVIGVAMLATRVAISSWRDVFERRRRRSASTD